MTNLKTLDPHDLVWQMRRNAPAFDTTWSYCDQGCGGTGRAGGPCWNCLRAELVTRVGEDETAKACEKIVADRDRNRDLYPRREVTP